MISGPAKAIAILLPIALIVVIVEIVMRFAGLASPNYWMVHEDAVVKGRPNACYVNRKENRNVVRLNGHGFHDRDWDDSGSAYGLLFLGDSMVEGVQVPVDSLFTSVLEDRFRESGMSVDVMNAAVSATGTGHQYLLWKTYAMDADVRIDHVVVCLFPQNDLKNNHIDIGSGPENYGVYLDADGVPFVHRSPRSGLHKFVRRLTDRSALLNLVYTRLHYMRTGGPREEEAAVTAGEERAAAGEARGAPGARGETPDAAPGSTEEASAGDHRDFAESGSEALWAESLERTMLLIESWAAEMEELGVEFSIVLIPNTDRNNFYENELVRRLDGAGRAGTMSVLSLMLGGRDPRETNSFDGETLGHFNYAGHRLVAEELFDWLAPRLRARGEGT